MLCLPAGSNSRLRVNKTGSRPNFSRQEEAAGFDHDASPAGEGFRSAERGRGRIGLLWRRKSGRRAGRHQWPELCCSRVDRIPCKDHVIEMSSGRREHLPQLFVATRGKQQHPMAISVELPGQRLDQGLHRRLVVGGIHDHQL